MARQSKSKMSKKARDFVSKKIKTIMRDFDKTGTIGNSKPSNRSAAQRQAIAVAFSMAQREGHKVAKNAEDYHNEVFALEEAIWNQLNICYQRINPLTGEPGHHRFPDVNVNLTDNIHDVYFDYYGDASLTGEHLAGVMQNVACLDCGATWNDINGEVFGWPNNPEIRQEMQDYNIDELAGLMMAGPSHICAHCGERAYQNMEQVYWGNNPNMEHGQGICVAEQEINCDVCNAVSQIGEYWDYPTVEDFNNAHGIGNCVGEEMTCQYCENTYEVGGRGQLMKMPYYSYHTGFEQPIKIEDEEKILGRITTIRGYNTIGGYNLIHNEIEGNPAKCVPGELQKLKVGELKALVNQCNVRPAYMVGCRKQHWVKMLGGNWKEGVKGTRRKGEVEVKEIVNISDVKEYLDKIAGDDPDLYDELIEDLFGAESVITFDLEEKDFALAQECVAAGGHEFSESMNKILETFMPMLLEDNAQTNQYFKRHQHMGPQSLSPGNVGFLNRILDMASHPQNYNLDIEPMPLECSRCGAVDWRQNNRWSHPTHPGLNFQQVMAMGVTTQCKSCGIHHAANQEAQHGVGLCVPLYDEITTCEECGVQAWLAVGANRNININIGEPDQQQILLFSIDAWEQQHGKGKCVAEAEIHCGHCDLTFTMGQGNQWHYKSMDYFKELHGSKEDEIKADGEVTKTLCWAWKAEKISVGDMKSYCRHEMGLEYNIYGQLPKIDLMIYLILDGICPLDIINWKAGRVKGVSQKVAKEPASIEELSPQEIYGLLSKKTGLFENLMNYYHQQHGAEGEEGTKNINLVLDQKGFIRIAYPYPATPQSSYTTKAVGGRDVFFKSGVLTVDIIKDREDSIDLVVRNFRGKGIFQDTGEELEGNEDFKGRVILDLHKRLYRREDDIWHEMVNWDERDKVNEVSNDWENLSWGAEGNYIAMVGDEEEIKGEGFDIGDTSASVRLTDTILPVLFTIAIFSIFSNKTALEQGDS